MHSFWGVFFIDASTSKTVETALSTMAATCRIGKNMQDFRRCLANSVEPWLLIFDNADDPSLDLSHYFPVGNQGTVIVTTRNPECRVHATAGSRELRDMEYNEATTLLLASAGKDFDDEYLRSLAQPIVQVLGCLALALLHAGASIRQGIAPLDEYLELFSCHRRRLLEYRPTQKGLNYEYTVYTTWRISVESIRKHAETSTNSAAADSLDLLQLFGFFHFDDITKDIFECAWQNLPEIEHYTWWSSMQMSFLRKDRLSKWNPLCVREAIQVLSSYSLIHFSQSNRRISLHPLVHSWIRDSLVEQAHL